MDICGHSILPFFFKCGQCSLLIFFFLIVILTTLLQEQFVFGLNAWGSKKKIRLFRTNPQSQV